MYKASDFQKPVYRAGEAARILGVTTQTLRRYDRNGKLKTYRTDGGHRLVKREDLMAFLCRKGLLYDDLSEGRRDVIYARSDTDEAELDRQVMNILYQESDLKNPLILREIGSGMDDGRKKLALLIHMVQDGKVKAVCVWKKSILAETGYPYLEALFRAKNVEVKEVGICSRTTALN